MGLINTPANDLKLYQPIFFQIGLIIAMAFFIVVFRIGADSHSGLQLLEPEDNDSVVAHIHLNRLNRGFVHLEEFNLGAREIPGPPAPPRNPVITHAPEDEIVEESDINFDLEGELESSAPDYLPVPLPSIHSNINYWLGDPRLPDMESDLLNQLRKLQENIEYPNRARRQGIEGKVYVQFILNEMGRAEDLKILRGIGAGCDEAVVEALKELRFLPGFINGRPVRVKLSFFVEFRLIYR